MGKFTPRYNHIFDEHNPVVLWGTPVYKHRLIAFIIT
jgi:hypothetical protein